MPNNGIFTTVSTIHSLGERTVVYIGEGANAVTDPYWYAMVTEDGMGSTPGVSFIAITRPLGQDHSLANGVALNPDLATGLFRNGTRVAVYTQKTTAQGNVIKTVIHVGRIADVRHQRDSGDRIIIKSKDIRDKLMDVVVVGRWMLKAGDSTPTYQQGWPAICNPEGRANCIYDAQGNPWFAEYPDYGLGNDEEPPAPGSDSLDRQSKASYWPLESTLAYLYNTVGPDAIVTPPDAFPWYDRVPSEINWPRGFGGILNKEQVANFDNNVGGTNNSSRGGARKGRPFPMDGLALPEIFDNLFAAAGPISWNVTFNSINGTGQYTSTLTILQLRYIGNGVKIPYAAGGDAATTLNIPCITRIDHHESSEGTVTRVVTSGGLVKTESRLSTEDETLAINWKTELQATAISEIKEAGGGVVAYEKIMSKYWEIFSTFRLAEDYDFQSVTPYSDYPRAEISRPVLTRLLSFRGGDTEGPSDGKTLPYPIIVEVKRSGVWLPLPPVDSIEILDNGTIHLPSLRICSDEVNSVIPILSFGSGAWNWDAVTVNDVRLTVAIPHDHRTVYAVKVSSDENGLTQEAYLRFNNLPDCPDTDKLAKTFSRTRIVDAGPLYQEWYRFDSWPVPEGAGATAAAANKATTDNPLRSDGEFLASHARRRLYEQFRLIHEGSTWTMDGCLCVAYVPGTAVAELIPRGDASLQPFPARCVIGRRRFSCMPQPDSKGTPSFAISTELMPV